MRKAANLTSEHLISYLGYQKAQGKSDASLCRYYMSLRAYVRYLLRTGIITKDLTHDLREGAPRCKQLAPRVPTPEQVLNILEQPDTNTEAGVRDRAILEVLYSSGLRATELCNLELRDFKGDSLLVQCGKGEKTRTVPLTEQAHHWVALYVNLYRGIEEGLLFVTQVHKKEIRSQFLSHLVGQYASKAGLKGVTTHTLRHACATHLLEKGASIRMIQLVLGHSSIASTERYTQLSGQSIQKMFNQFHPRAR